MPDEKTVTAKSIAKDGVWQVPPEQRPANWQAMGLKEPEGSAVAAIAESEPISTAMVVKHEAETIPASGTAINMEQIPHMQASLIEWCRSKVTAVKAEAAELYEAFQHALKHTWKSGTLKRQSDLASKRVVYYEKIRDALEAGYCIFPTVDCEVFAIRTGKVTPKYNREFVHYGGPDFEDKAQLLPSGEGRYVEPVPLVTSFASSREATRHDGVKYIKEGRTFTTHSFDEVDFPLVMAKPHIMDVAGKAMALKIFDEIGIIGDTGRMRSARRGQDPVIVGRIISPGYGQHKRITFLIAWHVDTKDL